MEEIIPPEMEKTVRKNRDYWSGFFFWLLIDAIALNELLWHKIHMPTYVVRVKT